MSQTQNASPDLHRLQVLLDAARLLNSTLELKEVTQIILGVVRAEVPVERVSVFVVDRQRKILHSLVAQELEDIEISLPLGSGLAGAVALTGETLDIPNAYSDPRFERSFDERLGFRTNDVLAMPVYNRHGEIVGALELLNRRRAITDTDREFLLGISVYIGLALQNVWSHAQLRAKEQLEQQLVALRDRLAETEQLSLTSELFSHVLNEINNPLAVAMGYAELARELEGMPAKVQNYLEKVTRGIDQTATAARKFREFIDSEKHQRTPVSLSGVLRQISDLRAQDWERQRIETTLFLESVPPVFAHEGQMQLVILYLIKNAEAAVQSEGSKKLRIRLSGTPEEVRVEVSDSGPSRTPEVQQRLLQPPFVARSTNRSGSLSLAIAFSIVEQHKGRIRLETNDGTGNNFIIELPAYYNEST